MCSHNREKYSCRDCNGLNSVAFCMHDKRRVFCSTCYPESAFKVYTRSAAKRELEFTLVLNDFKEITARPCIYCGEHNNPRGIDRENNSFGYVLTNCVPCCGVCNHMKGAMRVEEFYNHLHRIINLTDEPLVVE